MHTNRIGINGPIFELWPESGLSGQNASENDGNFIYFLWSKKRPQDVHTHTQISTPKTETEKSESERNFAGEQKKVDTWRTLRVSARVVPDSG